MKIYKTYLQCDRCGEERLLDPQTADPGTTVEMSYAVTEVYNDGTYATDRLESDLCEKCSVAFQKFMQYEDTGDADNTQKFSE